MVAPIIIPSRGAKENGGRVGGIVLEVLSIVGSRYLILHGLGRCQARPTHQGQGLWEICCGAG